MIGKKSKTEVGPSAYAKPYISAGATALQDAYASNAPNIADITDLLSANRNTVLGSTLSNPNLAAAGAYNRDVLGGKYLNGNPYLEQVIANTNDDVTDRVQAAIGTRGGAGGSAQTQLLTRELAKNEASFRAQNFNTQQGYQQQAVGNATALSGANAQNIAALVAYLSGNATIPQSGASTYAGGIGGLLGNYNTTTQSQGLGASLLGLAGAGLSGWASGGFKGV